MQDLIRRQAAINALENTECELLPEEWDDLTDAIMNVPSAQPEQRWIPVDERMPERNKMDSTGKYREAYLVTTGFMTFTARFNEYGYWVLWGYQQVLKNIIAWMPLPDPYKEEE